MSDLFGVADERPVTVTFYGGPNDGLLQKMTHPLPETLHVTIPVTVHLWDEVAEPTPSVRSGLYRLVKGTARYRWAGEQ